MINVRREEKVEVYKETVPSATCERERKKKKCEQPLLSSFLCFNLSHLNLFPTRFSFFFFFSKAKLEAIFCCWFAADLKVWFSIDAISNFTCFIWLRISLPLLTFYLYELFFNFFWPFICYIFIWMCCVSFVIFTWAKQGIRNTVDFFGNYSE